MKTTKRGAWTCAVTCAACATEAIAGPRDVSIKADDTFEVFCPVCGAAIQVADVPPKIGARAADRAEKRSEQVAANLARQEPTQAKK